ncbi:MAG: hypothetical protein LBB82_01480 [Treponema sp.]|nr:hypothetical protein [Treponema sp.]
MLDYLAKFPAQIAHHFLILPHQPFGFPKLLFQLTVSFLTLFLQLPVSFLTLFFQLPVSFFQLPAGFLDRCPDLFKSQPRVFRRERGILRYFHIGSLKNASRRLKTATTRRGGGNRMQ